MKRLNQNNTIATTAMLTKTNAMKNKMNLFAKVVMLVVMIMLLMPQEVWGEKWTQSGETWYILNIPKTNISGSSDLGVGATWNEDWSGQTYTVYTPTVQPTDCYYYAKISDNANKWPEFIINYGEGDKYVNGNKSCKSWGISYFCPEWRSLQFTMPSGRKTVSIKMNTKGCNKKKYIKLSIPLPKHTDFKSDKPTSYNFDDAQIGNTSSTIINFTDFFKSFYITDAITATITGQDEQYFHFSDNVSSKTIANGGSVYAIASCFTENIGIGSLNTSSANIIFEPDAARDFSAYLTITYDGHTLNIPLNGNGTTKNATFNWKIDDLAVGEEKEFSDVVGINEQDVYQTGLTIEETNSDGSTPLTESAKLNITGTTITGVAEGTTHVKATFTFGNTNYKSPASAVHELTVSLNELAEREIVWNADFTSLRDNTSAIDLSSNGWKATWQAVTAAASGDVLSYIIGDPSIASISGDTLTILKEGVTTITATIDADATYKKATMTKPLVVSSSTGCNVYLVNQTLNNTSDYTSPEFNGRPKKVIWSIRTNDNDDAAGTVYLKKADGTTISTQSIAKNTSQTYAFDVPSNYQDIRQFKVTGLISDGTWFWAYNRTLTSFQVLMASYLEPIANNSISFGEHDNFSETSLMPNIANYANLPGNINVEIVDAETGGNNTWDCFKFSDNSYASSVTTGGCGKDNQGIATTTIKFVPKQMGEHKARLKVSAYDGNSDEPVTFYIPMTGSGKKVTQKLTWNNEHGIFTGTHNALSGNVALTDAASTNGINVGGELTIIYSSSNKAVADVVTNEGIQYIDFKTAGTFRLRANCAGNNVYSDAAQIESGDITVSLATPTLTFSASPTSIPVFSTTTLTASSYDGAKINMTVTSKKDGTNPNATLSMSTGIASGEDVILTANTRASNAGEGNITVVASIAATDIYEAKTEPLTVNATKATPIINWPESSTELSGTRKVGDEVQLSATIRQNSTYKVTYVSSNTSLATVDNETGKMTCVAPGIVKITATFTGNVDLIASADNDEKSYLFLISPADFGEVQILSNEMIPFLISTGESGTFDIPSTDMAGFFVSDNNTTGWSNTGLTGITDGSTVYFKFQPNVVTEFSKTFTVMHSSKTYNGNLTGTGSGRLVEFGNLGVTEGTNNDWFLLPSNFFKSSTDTYSLTLNDGNTDTNDDKSFLVQIEGGSFSLGATGVACTTQYRIGFYPKNYKSSYSTTLTITDSEFGIAYPVTVSGTSHEKTYSAFPATRVGHATADGEDLVINMSYFDCSHDLTVTAPQHFLLRSLISSEPEVYSGSWSKTLNVGSRAKFKVRFAPESPVAASTDSYIVIHDNTEAEDAENYKYKLTINESSVEDYTYTFNEDISVMGITNTPLKHELSNFIPTGDITVDAWGDGGNNFMVSKTADGTYTRLITLGQSDAKEFYIKFAPLSGGEKTENIVITDVATGRVYKVKASGTTAESNFGNVSIGQASDEMTFSLQSLIMQGATSFTITSDNPYIFRVFTDNESTYSSATAQGAINLTGGNSFNVKFYPESAGEATGNITVKTDNNLTINIAVKGTGVRQSLNFGEVTLGNTSATSMQIDLTNMVSSNDYTVTSNKPAVFRINEQTDAVTLSGNASFSIRFYPQSATTYNDNNTYYVTIHDNSTNKDYRIYCSGKGTGRQQIDFGSVAFSEGSSSVSISVSGYSASGFKLKVDNYQSFWINGQVAQNGVDITPSNENVFSISFHPQTTGNVIDKVYITDGTNKYDVVNVTGNGTQKGLTLSWVDNGKLNLGDEESHLATTGVGTDDYITVTYSSSDNSILYVDNDNPSYVRAIGVGSATLSANIDYSKGQNSNFTFTNNLPISKTFTVTEERILVIVPGPNIRRLGNLKTNTVSIMLDATVQFKDGTSYSVQSTPDYSLTKNDGCVTLSGNTLTVVKSGRATLQMSVDGDSDKQIIGNTLTYDIVITEIGDCSHTELDINGFQFTSLSIKNLVQTLHIQKKNGVLPPMRKLAFHWEVVGWAPQYTFDVKENDANGNTLMLQKTGYYGSGNKKDGDNVDIDLTNHQLENICFEFHSTFKLGGEELSTSNASITDVHVYQQSYFRKAANEPSSLDFGTSEYGKSVQLPLKFDYSAISPLTFEIVSGDDCFSISDSELDVADCSDFGQKTVNVVFTPNKVGNCSAMIKIRAHTIDGDIPFEYEVSGIGVQRNQIVNNWSGDVNLTITQRYENISIGNDQGDKYKPATPQYNVSGKSIEYTSDNEEVLTVEQNSDGKWLIHIVSQGEANIKARIDGDDYTTAGEAIRKFIVPKGDQKIVWDSWDETKGKTIMTNCGNADMDILLDAKTQDIAGQDIPTDEITFAYEILSNSPCDQTHTTLAEIVTGSDGKKYLRYNGNGAGDVVVSVSVDECNNYYAATNNGLTRTLHINRTPSSEYIIGNITRNPNDLTYGDLATLSTEVTFTGNPYYNLNEKTEYQYTSSAESVADVYNTNQLKILSVGSFDLTSIVKENCYMEQENKSIQLPTYKSDQTIVSKDIPNQATFNKNQSISIDLNEYFHSVDKRHSVGNGYDGIATYLKKNENGEVLANTTLTYSVTFTKDDNTCPDFATFDGEHTITINGSAAGEISVTASQTGNDNYNAASSNETKEFRVNKVDPTVSVAGPASPLTYSTGPHTLTASSVIDSYSSVSDHNAAFTYTITEGIDVASINGDQLTILKAGTVKVTATQTANCIVNSATSEEYTITINRAEPQLEWNVEPTDATYDPANNTQSLSVTTNSDAAPTFSVTPVSPSTDGATINQSGVLTITKVGTYTVTVTLAETDKYNSASINKTIVISKADADFFLIADITMTYNDAAISLNNDISGGTLTLGRDYQVSYSVGVNGTGYFNVDDANKTINPLKANVDNNGNLVKMTLNASITGMTNYNDKPITGKVYVQRATQTIEWSEGIQTSYDTWNVGGEKIINLDDYTQSKDDSHDNDDITPDLTKTYELVISGMTGCDINDANVAYIDNYNVLHITGEASATLTIYAMQNGFDSNGENYTKVEEADNCTTVITINKITPTISFERINVNGGADVYYSDSITYTVSSIGTDYSVSDVSAFTFDITPVDQGAISDNVASHAGNVKIKASQAEDCMINGVVSGEVDVEIKKAPQHISWNVTDLGTLSATSTEGVELTAVAMNSRRNTQSGMKITYTVCDAEGNDITSDALITIGNDNKVYSAQNGSGEAWVKAVANGDDNYEASKTPVIKKITIEKEEPTITWTYPCSEQMTMHYRDKKQLTFSCDYTGYTASYTLTDPSDDTYVDITELTTNGNVKIIGVKPDNGTIGIKVTISDPVGNYSNYELNTAITTQKNNTEIDWNGQSFGTYTTADAGTEIVLTAFVKDSYMGDNIEKTVAYSFDETNVVEGCGNIVELIDDGKLKITGYAAGTVTLYASYGGDENYNASTEKSMQITVGKQTPSFAWVDNTDIQAIHGDEGVTAGEITKNGNGVVIYSSSDETVATIDDDGNITIVGAGTTTLSATLAADCQYEAVTTAIEKTLTVGQATGTINWVTGKEPHNDIYSTTLTEEVEATFNNTYDESIEYSSSNKDVADFENGVLKIYKAGTTIITATRAATRNFTEAKCSTEIVISKAPCTISITSPATITYGQNATIEYRTTNTDQNVSVIFTSGNANIVSISRDQATGAGAGTTYVYAEIAESDNYLQATSDDFNITVGKASTAFTINDIALTYGDLNQVVTINNKGISDYNVSFSINDGDESYIRINNDNTIDAIGAKCDGQGNPIVIPVTAHFTSTNYEIADVTFYVTVAKADQTITWDDSKEYSVSNMAGSINLSDYCTLTVGDGNISFTSSADNIAEVSENNLVIKQITAQNHVIITATAEGTANYKEATGSREFTINAEEPTISIEQGSSDAPIDLETTSPQVTSVTDGVDFVKLLKDLEAIKCNYDDVTYSLSSLKDYIATFANGVNIKAFKRSDKLGIQVTASVTGLESVTETLYVKIPRGTMRFTIGGNWSAKANWHRTDMLPSADDHNVSIEANCTIDNTAIAKCFDLEIVNGMLTVNADGVLDVKGTITNTEASKLKLKADASHSATVLFAGGSPDATVENYIKGTLHPEGEDENRINNPDWQYRGFVGNNPSLSDWNVVIFKWDETKNNKDCWGESPVYEKSGSYTEGSPWVGYSMANYDTGNPVRDYTSKLIPSDTTMTYNLSYTDHGQQYPNRGVNLITNSWSAPINMTSADVKFSDNNVERTLYFYKTRNHKSWEANPTSTFVVYPQNSGYVAVSSPMIASGQSFLVKATEAGATLTIKGSALAHEANGAMYAPAEKERFNVLSITMSNDTMADRVFLLESENCSRAFDNGYDGTKIEEGNMPQIFASNDFGHTAVNTDKTMLGQRIGYSAAEDGALCTITFNTDRLEGFSELYLYDRVAKRYADILAGDSYSFTGTKAGEEERFEIVGRRDDGSEFVTSSDMMIEVVGNRALLSGFAGGNDEVFITDMNGKRLWTERASNGPWFELPNLPAGVYLINCGEANCKFIVK